MHYLIRRHSIVFFNVVILLSSALASTWSFALSIQHVPVINSAISAGIADNMFHTSVRSPGEDVITKPDFWKQKFDLRGSLGENHGHNPIGTKTHAQAFVQSPVFDSNQKVFFLAWGGNWYSTGRYINTYTGSTANEFLPDERVNGDANFYKGAQLNTSPCHHPSSIALLPAQKGSSGRPTSTFVYIAAEYCSENANSDRVLVKKFTPNSSGGKWEDVGTMFRPGEAAVNLAMTNYHDGFYWLVLGHSGGSIDVYKAAPIELMRIDGSTNLAAWRHHWSTTLDSRSLYQNTSLLKYKDGLWLQAFQRSPDLTGDDNIHITKFEPNLKSAGYYNVYPQIVPGTTRGASGYSNPNFAAGVSSYISHEGKWLAAVIPHFAFLDRDDFKYWFHPRVGSDPAQFPSQ